MKNRWSDAAASVFLEQHAARYGRELVLRTYSGRLLGAEPALVLHGGGSTSVKASVSDVTGTELPAIYVKPSGSDPAELDPGDYVCLDLDYLQRLKSVTALSNDEMADLFRLHLLRRSEALPSAETLVHSFVPHRYVDHTHPEAILALTNTANSANLIREALGEQALVLPYENAGIDLARQVALALESNSSCRALVLRHHGLITWGDTAKESYTSTIRLVTRAEKYLQQRLVGKKPAKSASPYLAMARSRYEALAPIIRGKLARTSGESDDPHRRVILRPLIGDEALAFVDSREGKRLALAGPLTPDHVVRTKAVPLWIDRPDFSNPDGFRIQLMHAVDTYAQEYDEYLRRNGEGGEIPENADKLPIVLFIPGLGAVCCGWDTRAASVVRDITEQTVRTKLRMARRGLLYRGPAERSVYGMEYHRFQRAKVARKWMGRGEGKTALITGAAGAIGTGIAEALLDAGFHVALTDLPGDGLTTAVERFTGTYGDRAIGVAMDVTSEESVARGFRDVVAQWGGVDLLIANAGIAHVAALTELDPATFRKLERVNIEGTLFVVAEAARHFKIQGTGGDIVLVSTKNVFAPGARFGAYSATKAAAHQLARIASLELADIDVRVNMVAPDAVFSHGTTRSGLWATVGPDRMRARGLDEKGLEEYYRGRNLLKARVTAEHVGRAVLFFATRQTPTTGATIPVDGGLPDAVPR